jgi:hypothetical protein
MRTPICVSVQKNREKAKQTACEWAMEWIVCLG